MSFTFNQRIRALQNLNLLLSLGGILMLFRNDASWLWLLLTLLFFVVFGFVGINITLHRLLSHKCFKTTRALEIFLSYVSVLPTVGSTLAWVGLHRYHHGHSDTPNDPHSPHQIGAARAWWGLWKNCLISPSLITDLLKKKVHRDIHKHYFKVICGFCLVLALFHPLAIIFCYCIPATLCLHGTSAVSVLGHVWGYRNFDTKDHSKNSILLWIVSLGEGWHNNHHARPRAIHQGGCRFWEIDPAAWIIQKFLAKNV